MFIKTHIKVFMLYALLCMYAFAVLKPIMPLANDVLAHTFYKMQHIATVHYENGKYHLHDELATEADSQGSNSKEIPHSNIYETLANHIFTSEIENFKLFSYWSLKIFKSETPIPHEVLIQDPTPPPQS